MHSDVRYRGHKPLPGGCIHERMLLAVATPELTHEFRMDSLPAVLFPDMLQARLHNRRYFRVKGTYVVSIARKLSHRYRIWSVAEEFRLIRIDTDPDHGVVYTCRCNGMAYEYAAYLVVADINIVGPFHLCLQSMHAEEIDHGKGHRLRHGELGHRRQPGGTVKNGESEVFPGLGLPRVAPLSLPCGLPVGRHHHRSLQRSDLPHYIRVGGIQLIKM